MAHLDVDFTVACPALPAAGRTTQGGKHFVDGVPLGESYMGHHPITPMKESMLVPVLQGQTARRVGLLPYSTVTRGTSAIQRGLGQLRDNGYEIVIFDALTEDDLESIGATFSRARLTTGASGLALALLGNRRRTEGSLKVAHANSLSTRSGLRAVISGSCSEITQKQVAIAMQEYSVMQIDPLACVTQSRMVDEALSWASRHLAGGPIVISSTASPVTVEKIQSRFGVREAASSIERVLAEIAHGLVCQGVRQMIIAGGETSGAVAETLGIRTLELGPTIDSGVSWTFANSVTLEGQTIALALKPGNFGETNLFINAWKVLDGSSET